MQLPDSVAPTKLTTTCTTLAVAVALVVAGLSGTMAAAAPNRAAVPSTSHPVAQPVAGSAAAPSGDIKLVSDASIQLQRQLTTQSKLRNGIPVIVRQIPNSDILQVNLNFAFGLKDLKPGRKVLNEWLWTALPLGAKGFPKEKVFSLVEQYGLEIGCTGGIEYSACALGTLNEYWPKALPLLAAMINAPTFEPADVALTKERITASLRDVPSDPGNYVNEIVNAIFYPPGHPYRLNHDEALSELAKLDRQDLLAVYKETVQAQNMAIVVVTSLPASKIVADLNKAFGGIKTGVSPKTPVPVPVFDAAKAYSFFDRELPTAYIRIKTNAPGIRSKDAMGTRLLFEILSEELGDEIRTKRSLSYAVHSFLIQYSIGVGVINASTSKPKETLAAIEQVLQAIKAKTYSHEELEEYKHGFATSYYLTQETHASLAAALASSYFFYGDPTEYYDMPRRLDKVTPADIHRLANTWLNDLRIGVIDGRKDFQDEWARSLITATEKTPPPAAAPAPAPTPAQ